MLATVAVQAVVAPSPPSRLAAAQAYARAGDAPRALVAALLVAVAAALAASLTRAPPPRADPRAQHLSMAAQQPPPKVTLAITTSPNAESSRKIALSLVEKGVAACVTALPGARSVYKWRGAVEEATEEVLLIKTTQDSAQALKAALREVHSYEVPELLLFDAADGLPAYLQWVADATARKPQ